MSVHNDAQPSARGKIMLPLAELAVGSQTRALPD